MKSGGKRGKERIALIKMTSNSLGLFFYLFLIAKVLF